jgi:hypothetical protein
MKIVRDGIAFKAGMTETCASYKVAPTNNALVRVAAEITEINGRPLGILAKHADAQQRHVETNTIIFIVT